MVDGQYIPNLFIAPEVRHDKTSYICLKTLLQEVISEPLFYGDLIY